MIDMLAYSHGITFKSVILVVAIPVACYAIEHNWRRRRPTSGHFPYVGMTVAACCMLAMILLFSGTGRRLSLAPIVGLRIADGDPVSIRVPSGPDGSQGVISISNGEVLEVESRFAQSESLTVRDKIRGAGKSAKRAIKDQASNLKTRIRRTRNSWDSGWIHDIRAQRVLGKHSILWHGLVALAIVALLFVGYVFLDASTRGHFSWPLRIASVFAFALLFAVVAILA